MGLAARGHRVGLWTPDASAATSPLIDGSGVERLSGSPGEALDRFAAGDNVDVLHDNGIWLPHNHRLATEALRRRIPRVVSLRGMLEPWAFEHKREKKRLAWWLYQRRDLRKADCHHATAETERGTLSELKLGVPIRVIPNGIDVPDVTRDDALAARNESPGATRAAFRADARESTALRTALFLGRLYPVKGLPMLIAAWARVRPSGWRLRIAGPDEAGHRAELERAVREANLEDVIAFDGPLDGHAKRDALLGADLFVLPTHSESLGIAVAVALAHGVPVLTTRGAPWPMLPERDCGWWVEPSIAGIELGLRRATALDDETLAGMGANGRELVRTEFGWDRVVDQFVDMYRDLTKGHGWMTH
jgi:glycosyltransferase involved in cell wall biosynthesis